MMERPTLFIKRTRSGTPLEFYKNDYSELFVYLFTIIVIKNRKKKTNK